MNMATPPTGRPVGRPTRLTPEMQRVLLAALRGGLPRGLAAKTVGIGESTLAGWLSENTIHPDFRRAALIAEGECAAEYLGVVESAAKGELEGLDRRDQVKAAQWVLERRFREGFAPRSEVSATVEAQVDVHSRVLIQPLFSDDQLAELQPAQLQAAVLGLGQTLMLPDVIDASEVEEG